MRSKFESFKCKGGNKKKEKWSEWEQKQAKKVVNKERRGYKLR